MTFRSVAAAAALVTLSTSAWADIPAEIAAPGQTEVVTLHAQGAQVYECAAAKDGKLAWSFREPIATLTLNGKTVGRHYAGPNWEYMDGSTVVAKVSGRARGATANDIPWLKLTATSHRGSGQFSEIATIQRINTAGGQLEGACSQAGTFKSVAYSTDYVFLKK